MSIKESIRGQLEQTLKANNSKVEKSREKLMLATKETKSGLGKDLKKQGGWEEKLRENKRAITETSAGKNRKLEGSQRSLKRNNRIKQGNE